MRRGYVPNFKLAFLDLVLAFMANLEFSETNLGGRGGQVRPIEPAQPVDSGKRIVSQTSLDLFDKSSSGQGKRKKAKEKNMMDRLGRQILTSTL
jgi:hypothetical protein